MEESHIKALEPLLPWPSSTLCLDQRQVLLTLHLSPKAPDTGIHSEVER